MSSVGNRMRAVTHLDIDDQGITKAKEVVQGLLATCS
jgi:hypothetical protein